MYNKYNDTTGSPARDVFQITPSNTAIDPLPKALLMGSAGTITLRAVDSAADVTISVNAGDILPIRAQFVRASTTVTAVFALC